MKGGTDGLGFNVLYLLSFATKSLSILNIFSNSERLSFFDCNTEGNADAAFSGDREGLPIRGDGSGEFTFDEAGVAFGVRPLFFVKSLALNLYRVSVLPLHQDLIA